MVETFRDAFHSHYFSYLKEALAHTHRHPRGSVKFRPKPGDVVLIHLTTALQGTWPLGVVTSIDKWGGKAWVSTVDLLSAVNPTVGSQQLGPQVQYLLQELTVNRLFPVELAADSPNRIF